MSIVELSNSVDKLAKAVAEKNKELDKLKQSYEEKIDQLNECILLLTEGIKKSEEFTEYTLLDDYKKAITCSNCRSSVVFDENYLVVPLGKISKQIQGTELSKKFHQLEISRSTEQKGEKLSTVKPKKKERTKNKIICSYCKKPGHTRAKCEARLSTPLENQK